MPDNMLQKSWLFEIVDSRTSLIEQSFTLILPPQSYTVREKQRVNVTKTFKNAFVDDYGPDNLEITIKGISGASKAFPTYRTYGASGSYADIVDAFQVARDVAAGDSAIPSVMGGSVSESYDAKGAFYTFRNDIMRYKDRGDWDKKELRVYDLADEQAYKCVLLEFTVDRTKDQPFWYPFTISLLVYERMDSKIGAGKKKVSNVINIAKDPTKALDQIESNLDKLTALYQDVMNTASTVRNSVAKMRNTVTKLRSTLQKYASQVTRLVETPLDLARILVDTAGEAAGIVFDLYDAGRATVDNYTGIEEMLQDTLRQSLGVYGYAITEGVQTTRSINIEMSTGLNTSTVAEEGESEPDPEPAFDIETLSYTGYTTHFVSGSETLQAIALKTLGDSNLWVYIAAVNNIYSNEDIEPGDVLYIPVLSDSVQSTMNDFIISEDPLTDPLGTDIQIGPNGEMIIGESGTPSLVSGLSNLVQAINMRLNSIQGSLIKQTAIGISGGAGMAGTSLSLAYLRMSIRSTLLEDPRISDVKNLVVSINKDVVNASMNIIVTGYSNTIPVSVEI